MNSADQDFWIVGRNGRYCDVQITEATRSLSRLHCIIKYFPQSRSWAILDGAFYTKEMQQALGKKSSHESGWIASDNGTFLNGRRVTAAPGNWDPISPDDRLQLGNLICSIAQSCDDTLQNYEAEIPRDTAAQSQLGTHIAEKTEAQAQPASMWTVLLDLLNWIQEKPSSWAEGLFKLGILIVLAATTAAIVIALHG
ncbi:FHA domain-containing protein [Almyronema epifaneia S1]|uniref:FHA domain-containing protein n=1 Tax=Almyronema epifaneia S1 TaxID=2991925 RepID=A0ABW6ILU1_9CYAN